MSKANTYILVRVAAAIAAAFMCTAAFGQPKSQRDPKCVDWTQGRLTGLDYSACQATARAERAKFELARLVGQSDGAGLPNSHDCLEKLREIAKKAVDDTHACLSKLKQSRAIDALDDYYAAWMLTTATWIDLSLSQRAFNAKRERLEEALEEKKVKFEVLIR